MKFEKLEALKEKLLTHLQNRYRLERALEFPFLVSGDVFGFDRGSKLRGTLWRSSCNTPFQIFCLQLSLEGGDFVTFVNPKGQDERARSKDSSALRS